MDPITLASLAATLLPGGGTEAGSGLSPATSLLGLPETLFKGITGVSQMIRGDKLGRTERPVMGIPSAQNEAVQTARGMAMNPRLPGQGLMQDQLDLQGAGGIRGAEGLGAGSAERIAGFANVNRNLMDQMRNIGISAANKQTSNLQNLQNALQSQAQWQQKIWDYNIDQPFQEKMAAANRLTDAGNENVAGVLKELGGLGAATIGTQGGPQTPVAPALANTAITTPATQQPANPGDNYDFGKGDPMISLPQSGSPYLPGTSPWSEKVNSLYGNILNTYRLK